MTAQTKATLKTYFDTGDKPTATEFADLIDSFADADHNHDEAYSAIDHNHSDVYEPLDPTILKEADIGTTVQAYDATILKEADIGTKVLAPDGDGSALTGLAVPIFTKSFTSTAQTITSAGALTLAHGLGAAPALMAGFLKCIDGGGDAGYAQNDEVLVGLTANGAPGATSRGIACMSDATNIVLRFGSEATALHALHKTSGADTALTNTKWNLIVKAWA